MASDIVKIPNYAIEPQGDVDHPFSWRVLRLSIRESLSGHEYVQAVEVATFQHQKHAEDWVETYRGEPLRATG
jgi:hypothetical protein